MVGLGTLLRWYVLGSSAVHWSVSFLSAALLSGLSCAGWFILCIWPHNCHGVVKTVSLQPVPHVQHDASFPISAQVLGTKHGGTS
jgi:hypothetical protein